MSESQESKDTPKKIRSPIGGVIGANLELNKSFIEYANTLADVSKMRVERLTRSQEALDSALLNGTIGEERAKEELDRLEEERKEIVEEAKERMRLMAQLNRDIDATRTLHVNRLMEKGKLDYDFHKHFTTLGTGSILLISALSRLLFPKVSQTEGLTLLFISLALLVVSVMAAANAMRGSVVDTVLGETSAATERVSDVSWSCFSIGIISFVLYVAVNIAGLQIEQEWVFPLILVGGSILGNLAHYVSKKRHQERRTKPAPD
jgi:hypothetical protein